MTITNLVQLLVRFLSFERNEKRSLGTEGLFERRRNKRKSNSYTSEPGEPCEVSRLTLASSQAQVTKALDDLEQDKDHLRILHGFPNQLSNAVG